jgi:hypothetical protein
MKNKEIKSMHKHKQGMIELKSFFKGEIELQQKKVASQIAHDNSTQPIKL